MKKNKDSNDAWNKNHRTDVSPQQQILREKLGAHCRRNTGPSDLKKIWLFLLIEPQSGWCFSQCVIGVSPTQNVWCMAI